MKTIHVIGIGGTGMRCLESFVHLCAMGMFDDHEVNMLALDTDRLNGNFARLQELVGFYQKINKGVTASDTYFSAKINYSTFSPEYDKSNTTFNSIADYSTAAATQAGDAVKYRESDVCDLFLNPDVREMDLAHGYRAQTQLGSMLMYHAIIEEAYKTRRSSDYVSQLREFIRGLNESKGNEVFIFGSVFGGTGASSIPIIPRAFQKAAEIMFGEQAQVIEKNFYGSVVMTNYFSFDIQKQDKIVATTDKFALNSQAALTFYATDKTVKNTYRRLYLIGRDQKEARKVSTGAGQSDTGGAKQRNPADFLELMAATAAYDFFKTCDGGEEAFRDTSGRKSPFCYRTLESDANGCLNFECFVGEEKSRLEEKSGLLTAAALIHMIGKFFTSMKRDEFPSVSEEELQTIESYFRYYYDVMGTKDGWLPQMYHSAVECGYQGFLFGNDIFNADRPDKLKYNEKLYTDDHAFKLKGLLFGNIVDTVKERFKDINPSEKENLQNLLKRTYLTFQSLYGFK